MPTTPDEFGRLFDPVTTALLAKGTLEGSVTFAPVVSS